MKRYVQTVLAALVLFGTALGCGGGDRAVMPTNTNLSAPKDRPKGAAIPPPPPR